MAIKKIDILWVPEYTDRVRQIKVPRAVPILFALFLAIGITSLFLFIQDYISIKVQMPRLAQLERENQEQKEQFVHLAERIDRITKKTNELREFDRKLKVMVNLDAKGLNTQTQGVGGSTSFHPQPGRAILDAHKESVRLMHQSLDDLDHEISLGEQDKTELYTFIKSQKMLLASTPSIWPTKGWLSSRFGYRTSPFTGEREFHKGIDICARMKAPIVATADGIVSSVGVDYGYGKVLSINHGYGLLTRYAHLSKALVKKGQYVKRGETIALVGNTGKSTGPHLHYEVHLNRVAVDPLRYILN